MCIKQAQILVVLALLGLVLIKPIQPVAASYSNVNTYLYEHIGCNAPGNPTGASVTLIWGTYQPNLTTFNNKASSHLLLIGKYDNYYYNDINRGRLLFRHGDRSTSVCTSWTSTSAYNDKIESMESK